MIEALPGVVDLGELPNYPDQVDGIMLTSCAEAPEDDDYGIDEDGYCAHGRLCYRRRASILDAREAYSGQYIAAGHHRRLRFRRVHGHG